MFFLHSETHPRSYLRSGGHIDGFYSSSRAEDALQSSAAAVADLLETPPWCPTAEEVQLRFIRGGKSFLGN